MQHLLYVAVYVIGHELYHVHKGESHTEGKSAFSKRVPSEEGAMPLDVLATERVCRNYAIFEQYGYKATGMEFKGSAEVGVPEDLRGIVAFLDDLWRAEQQADVQGTQYMAKMIEKLVGANLQVLDDAVVEFSLQSLFTLANYYWYRRLEPFAVIHCEEFAGQSYFLSRCMCKDRRLFAAIETLYGDTHPPLYLRVANTAKLLLNNIDMAKLRQENRSRLYARLEMMERLLEVPSKLALGACLLRNESALSHTKNVVLFYPALEGFFGEINQTYPGAPPDSIRAELIHECLAPRLEE